jgi:hypothetical protein
MVNPSEGFHSFWFNHVLSILLVKSKKGVAFLIQLPGIMVILIPIITLLLTAGTLILLRLVRPHFKHSWILAMAGATLALIGVFLWHIYLPASISLIPWQPVTLFFFAPTWLADVISWPYAVSLAALGAAVIWTSIVRAETDPIAWAGILLLTALGILAVAAENPLTLILVWSAIDLVELITMLRSADGVEQNQGVVIAFAARVAGTALVLWANIISTAGGILMSFRATPASAGIFLLLATGLRLGVFPLHLPYRKENVLRRGFGTTLRLVSATASLNILARISASSLKSSLIPYLLILAAIAALYGAWMWLRASDEILGRPFWVLGMASLSFAASLRGNPTGSMGWGIILILGGGLLFLFSARQRSIIWLPLLGLWGLSSLPFSPTASAWQTGNMNSWIFVLPFLPAQALLMAGFIRHALHPGETSFESQERWTRIIYPTGLILLVATVILLGLWGWDGAQMVGLWWAAIIANIFAGGFTLLAVTILVRLALTCSSNQWTRIFRLERFYDVLYSIYDFFRRIADVITSSLEGEGGLLWSLLLLALILSVLSTQGR